MKYDLQDIATVSGMPGLFKVLKPTRTGVVLESLDDIKKRVMAQTRHKISILKEISIFTTGTESVVLENVFEKIYAKHADKLTIDHKNASKDELQEFLGEIVPNFDEDRVYPSDIKKLIQWYKIIARELKPIKEEKKEKPEGKKEGEKPSTSSPEKSEAETKKSTEKKAPKKKTTASDSKKYKTETKKAPATKKKATTKK